MSANHVHSLRRYCEAVERPIVMSEPSPSCACIESGSNAVPGWIKTNLRWRSATRRSHFYFHQDLQPLFHFLDSFFQILRWEVFFEFAQKCLYSLRGQARYLLVLEILLPNSLGYGIPIVVANLLRPTKVCDCSKNLV